MNFIVFSDDWGRHPSSCEHIFRRLLPENKIIWVNTIGYRKPSFSVYDIKRSFGKIFSWFAKPGSEAKSDWPENLEVLSPVIIPYNNIKIIRQFNRIMVKKAIGKTIARLELKHCILVSSLPNVVDFYKDHPDSLKIYYCVDDFTQFPGVDDRTIKQMEDELIEVCDLILYTAGYLEAKFADKKKKKHYLPHGVDFGHFSRIKKTADSDPDRPVIGFFGYLSEWVDLEMIAEIARNRPHWKIILIGGTDRNIDFLQGIDNIELTGAVRYDQLPGLAARFDIGLIPFEINNLTKAVNPLKFLEYTAMGIPTVSTPLPELQKYEDLAYFAVDSRDFIEKIEKALSEDSPEKRKQRKELAHKNSWQSRADELIKIIKAHDNSKFES